MAGADIYIKKISIHREFSKGIPTMKTYRSACFVLIAMFILVRARPGPGAREGAGLSPPVEFIFLGGLGVTNLTPDAAKRIRTSQGGFSFDLGGGVRFFKIFDIGVGAAMCWLADRDEFTNSTTGGERSSSVWPLLYYAQAGVQVPVPVRAKNGNFPVWLAFHAGTMGVSVDRSISSCTNCDVEKLSLKGGWFYTPEIRLELESGIYIGVGYTVFCSCAELKSRFMVTMGGYPRN